MSGLVKPDITPVRNTGASDTQPKPEETFKIFLLTSSVTWVTPPYDYRASREDEGKS